MQTLILDGQDLSLEDVQQVADEKRPVELGQQSHQQLAKGRELVEKLAHSDQATYSINTGFGSLKSVRIPEEDEMVLQHNIILSHSAAVGDPYDERTTRAIMLLRAHTLSKAYSGVRPVVIQTLLTLLNKNILPVIPQQGSVGACGDLAPLAHVALTMIGHGPAHYNGQLLSGQEAMKAAECPMLELKEKEGLALINGTQAMSGHGVLSVVQASHLAGWADAIAALSIEVLNGTNRAFDPRISQLKAHSGQIISASRMYKALEDSKILRSHEDCDAVQDPYSLRCSPQVHGAARDSISHTEKIIHTEINSITDNPILFVDDQEAVSNGNFHGAPVSVAMDILSIGLCQLANISERRIDHLINSPLSDLPNYLTKEPGLQSGVAMCHVTACSLASENKSLAHPASVDNIPTWSGQEDHVSMGTIASRKAAQIVKNVRYILAIELLCATQALDFRNPDNAATATRKVYDQARKLVPTIKQDRPFYKDIEVLAELLKGPAPF